MDEKPRIVAYKLIIDANIVKHKGRTERQNIVHAMEANIDVYGKAAHTLTTAHANDFHLGSSASSHRCYAANRKQVSQHTHAQCSQD
jgi:hypothetical protein